MSKGRITIIGVSAIIIITAVYFYLGGLNKVEYSIENVSDYNLVGVAYRGKSDSSAIEEAFFKAKELIEDEIIDGTLVVIHYNDSTLAEDEQKLFIGIKLDQGLASIPQGYTRITIPTKRAVRASIEAHNVVMPSPKTIENNIREKAAEASIRLQDFTVEQYVSANEIIIDMLAK
ncbi:hypothetical protein BFP97_11120 [Roseivirga sp. 4D4]|uniref:GyrI-like domain-containing protein n=1 Tax=Roseivirga sp. 4D4 TaxID=1889784 RepID=UPI000852D026|nr:GyrI-like domain-containing protein [Roseivirga sp. 4D4]OEK02037.1 hypothetical protein BFP97_11120 [Roseivirga sp. 4D4]